MPQKRKSLEQLTLEHLQGIGFTAQIVQHQIHRARRWRDLFGVFDVLAIKAGVGIVGVQATDISNFAARWKKVTAEPRGLEWLRAGGMIEVWGWIDGDDLSPYRRESVREEHYK